MAKRLSDTDKWNKQWFRTLSPKLKCAWEYLRDRCDHAGIWPIDMDLMSFQVGSKVELRELLEAFGDRVERLSDDRLFLIGFVGFQYGEFNPSSNAHKSALKILQGYGKGWSTLDQQSPNPTPRVLDKDKDQAKALDQAKDKECSLQKFDFGPLYRKYPRKKGKTQGLKIAARDVRTPEEYENLSKAIDRFIEHHIMEKTEAQFIPYFSTFMGEWRDWLDPEHGTSQTFAPKQMGIAELLELERREREATEHASA